MLDHPVLEVLPQLNEKILNKALLDGEEAYAIILPIQRKEVVVNVAPIIIDEQIKGAILTFQESARISEMDSELRWELYQRGMIAKYSFQKMHYGMIGEQLIHRARMVANYSAPLLLTGETGCGKTILAQCIHNESIYRNNAFVPVDCAVYPPDILDTMLFGNYTARKEAYACMAEMAQDGTLFLAHIDTLPMELQYKLLQLIEGKFLHNGANRAIASRVRIIASSDTNLIIKVEQGEFRSDLYYAISILQIDIPPMRQRRDEIPGWIDYYLNQYQDKYKRYIHLTNGARKYLEEYDWPGNLHQIKSMCERIVLMTEKRSIDEVFLRRQMESMTPKISAKTEQVIVFKDPKAAQISEWRIVK